jgi:O-antigen/teichoic acid export membrane protein
MYSPSDLAYYNKGMRFPVFIMTNINTSISAVMFPVVSKLQDDLERLKALTRKSIRVSSYFIFPMMIGLAVMADPFIELLLTEKWLPCVPYLRIACFTNAIIIMQIAMQNAIMARGRSDVFLKMDIISKILGITLLICVMKQGVMVIALTSLVTGTFNVLMKVFVSKRMFGYRFREHIADNVPILVVSTIMGAAVYLINLLGFSSIITMCIQIPLGIVIYILLSLLLKLEGFTFVVGYIKTLKRGTHCV